MLEPPLVDTERPKLPKEKMLEIPGHYFGKATRPAIASIVSPVFLSATG
jgi:hypothetical protein